MFGFGFRDGSGNKTIRPNKAYVQDSQTWNLHRFSKALVQTGDLAQAVQPPPDADLCQWLAVHVIDFYNITNLLFGSISEYCTDASCPTMCVKDTDYYWRTKPADPPYKYGLPATPHAGMAQLSAPKYVESLMAWTEAIMEDDKQFPTGDGAKYPSNFRETVSQVFRRLIRVFAHIYYQHFQSVEQLQLEPQLNTAFKHFLYFVFEFGLI
eukprot:gene215-2373_t